VRSIASVLLYFSVFVMSSLGAEESLTVTIVDANDEAFSVQSEACYRLPGLVLEMGSDLPLDNFAVCFNSNAPEQVISRTQLPQAHHYLNLHHWLVSGETICTAGSIARQLTLLRLEILEVDNSPLFIEVFSQCGAQGCEYELAFMSQGNTSWCFESMERRKND